MNAQPDFPRSATDFAALLRLWVKCIRHENKFNPPPPPTRADGDTTPTPQKGQLKAARHDLTNGQEREP